MIVGSGLGIWVVIYQDGRQGKQMPVTTNETFRYNLHRPQPKKQLKSPVKEATQTPQ